MQVMDVLRQSQNGAAIQTVAQAFRIPPQQAEAAIAALVPQVASVLERNTLSRGGIADTVAADLDCRGQTCTD